MNRRIPQLRGRARRVGSVLLTGSVLSAGTLAAVTAAPASGAIENRS